MERRAPTPDLRIIPVTAVHPHEQHDSQRAIPLMERLKAAEHFANPPIVAPISDDQFVILDGANRCFSFQQLGYPHILVQVVNYESGLVQLDTWQHIVSDWDVSAFITALEALDSVAIEWRHITGAICHIHLHDGRVLSLRANAQNTQERNTILRDVVSIYQRNAVLHRTAILDPEEVWPLYPSAIALIVFPPYRAPDIIAAAKYRDYLPPGVSRHLIHGRALLVNYPMEALRDTRLSLHEKNRILHRWIQEKLNRRQVRYYAETTYQFDE